MSLSSARDMFDALEQRVASELDGLSQKAAKVEEEKKKLDACGWTSIKDGER